MPDDRFAPQATTFLSSVQMEEELHEVSTVRPSSDRVPGAETSASDRLLSYQEIMIRNAFSRVESEADASRVAPPYSLTKRMLDLAIAVPFLFVFSPLMLLIAIAIRIDSPGPALFVQHRVGKGGHFFKMLKFRSMTDGCSMLDGQAHKVKNDMRVTRIGKFLRKTSLDELPQLINVILGQMSLVGPRPELPAIVLQKYESWQYMRLAVPQGITGWWQVTGRGKKLLWKNTSDDIYYIEHASLWFDVKLLLMTIRAVLSRDGAF